MSNQKPVILIGPRADDPAESVSAVNRSFVEGLSDHYRFVEHGSNRRFGMDRQTSLNPLNALYFLKHAMEWLWHLIRHRPAIAHYVLNSEWALVKSLVLIRMARVFGAKTVGHLHDGKFISFLERLPRWKKRIALRELLALDGFVVLSEWWHAAIADALRPCPEKLFVVNNSIDREFESTALSMPCQRDELVILSLGVMGRPKGVFDLIEAAAMIQSRGRFRLILVGPEREPDIHRQVREYVANHSLSDTVEIRGGVFGSEKIDLYRAASVFVLPSHYENFPLVVLEAAAAGQAIITTPVGAVPEFFEDGVSALFVQPGKPDQLAAALARLIEHPEERVRLGLAARQTFVSRLSRSQVMDSMHHVYQQVLAGSQSTLSKADGKNLNVCKQ